MADVKAYMVLLGWACLVVPAVIFGGILYSMVAIEPTHAARWAAIGAVTAFALLLLHLRWALGIMVKSTREVLERRAKQNKAGADRG